MTDIKGSGAVAWRAITRAGNVLYFDAKDQPDATDLCAAFEHAVTQQTQAYEFQRGTTPGKWLFRCSDWIDLSAVLASLPTQESEDGR